LRCRQRLLSAPDVLERGLPIDKGGLDLR
jgi:hypothetical protein